LRQPRPPMVRKSGLTFLVVAVVASIIPLASSSSPSSPSSPLSPSSLTSSPARWAFPSAKLLANRSRRWRNNKSSFRSVSDDINGERTGCDRSDVFDEFELEDDDYSSDDESILWTSNSVRGGGASTAAAAAAAVIGRGSSRTSSRTRGGIGSSIFQQKGQRNNKRKIRQNQKLQQLEIMQQIKLRQFRRAFRQKQRQFQSSLYSLNSRFNRDSIFPKPPYSLWRMETEPSIGKTTLTGKIFFLNIAFFGLQTMYPQITASGAKRSDMILEGRQLYRLLTPIFLHGGIGHLMANSYSLKSMGANVERAFGQPRLLATYLVSGIMGNVVSAVQSPNPAVGASGAIFGLVGAYYTFLSRNAEVFGRMGEMQKSALIETIGFNLLLGMTNPMIDNWGHAGGFVGGVGMAYLIGPKLYAARVPLGEEGGGGGFGAGRVLIDRPTLTFRTPDFLDEGFFWLNDNVRNLGRRATTGVRGLLNGNNGGQEYYLDRNVDYSMGTSGIAGTSGNGDGTIYRTLKGDNIPLEGSSVNVTPSDGYRQDATELDPTIAARQQSQRRRPPRRSMPKAGYSIRPTYGHLYR